MGTTVRLFMAALLFTTAAAVVSAQDASAAPPPAAPDAVKPVEPLQAIPFAEPGTPAVEPALTIDQSAVAVEPVVPAAVEAPVAEKPKVTTTRRVTKKTARKPAEKLPIQASDSFKADAAVASLAAVDAPANPPPPDAAANAAPAPSIVPPAPAAKPASVEPRAEGTKPEPKMGVGGWFLIALVIAALFTGITLFLRRRTSRRTSIVDFTTISPDLKPSLVSRH